MFELKLVHVNIWSQFELFVICHIHILMSPDRYICLVGHEAVRKCKAKRDGQAEGCISESTLIKKLSDSK